MGDNDLVKNNLVKQFGKKYSKNLMVLIFNRVSEMTGKRNRGSLSEQAIVACMNVISSNLLLLLKKPFTKRFEVQ